jgi:hypothetical protein
MAIDSGEVRTHDPCAETRELLDHLSNILKFYVFTLMA